MKRKLLAILTLFLLCACSKDSGLPEGSEAVVSNDSKVTFEQLVLLIQVKTSDSTWLVVNSLDSVSIYVNNTYWNKLNSVRIDTSRIEKISSGNSFLSTQKLNYLVLARQGVLIPALKTAGDFSTYLNSWYTIKPGDYACFIESFSVTLNNGDRRTFFPHKYIPFKIASESASAFVGEIELQVKL